MSISKIFSPNKDLKEEEVLYEFIRMAKNDLEIFGKDLPFNDNMWDITDYFPGKQNTKNRLLFSNLEDSKKSKKMKDYSFTPMREPFLSFSKAYLRYSQGINPIKSFTLIFASLRLLEHALIDMTQKANPVDLSTTVLNRAVEIGKEHFTQAVLYRLSQRLEKIAKFISDKRISRIYIDWKNPVSRPSDSQKVGKKADDRRNQKMPSTAALEALPEIFLKTKDPKDILITSIIAILFGSPVRIGEVLLLQELCEVIQKDSEGKERYGLRWYPEKGAEPMVKWIIPSMVDVVKKAISNIRELTEQARKVARWYEENPTKLYLSENLEYLRNKETITSNEAALILLGEPVKGSMTTFYRTLKINYDIKNFKEGGYKSAPKRVTTILFKDLEKAIISRLPKNFPYINKDKKFKYSETLLIQRLYEYNEQRTALFPLIDGFSIGFINDALGAREGISKASIFDKYGYKEPDGTSIKVTTHQFRHYLNTLAQKGGASQLDIAKWSGRKDVRQNDAYNHVSADEMLMLVKDAVGDDDLMSGQLSNIEGIKKKVVISRDEYAELKIKTAHMTDFGVCIHDFSMMPCQLHMDCINCTEQVCIKGDKKSNENIRQRRADVEQGLEVAIKAQEKGHVGAHRWIKHKSIELQKLTQLCDIFDNENIKDGTLIQMSEAPSISPIEQSQVRHQEATGESTNNLDAMRNLLEDLGEEF